MGQNEPAGFNRLQTFIQSQLAALKCPVPEIDFHGCTRKMNRGARLARAGDEMRPLPSTSNPMMLL
jgi:hypothetical protein